MKPVKNYDAIYAAPQSKISDFKFDENVVRVFPDMIDRSIPGYNIILPLLGLIAGRYAQADSFIYDLGCSLGAATLAIRPRIHQPHCRIIAVDNSAAMIAKCREIVAADARSTPVELIQADIQEVEIERASVVVLNFTLQFLAPENRANLIQKIFDGLLPGGILILSEKVVFADANQGRRMVDLHHDFKRANGYSELEIAQKRTALENVMIPDTIEQHAARVLAAGFESFDVWFQAFNFVSMLAIKAGAAE